MSGTNSKKNTPVKKNLNLNLPSKNDPTISDIWNLLATVNSTVLSHDTHFKNINTNLRDLESNFNSMKSAINDLHKEIFQLKSEKNALESELT